MTNTTTKHHEASEKHGGKPSENKLLKILAVIGGVFVFLIGAIFVMAWGATAGVAETGDKFFAMLKNNQMKEAYDSTAMGFRASTNFEEFSAYMKKSGMDKYASGTWTDREVNNDEGRLAGSITTSDKETIPLEVVLKKESDKWKVYRLQQIFVTPAEAELKKLANDSMDAFGKGIKANDFNNFYAGLSDLWKAQTTAEDLKTAFKDFVDKKVDLAKLAGVDPVFDNAPGVNNQGVLELNGFYPYDETFANFSLKYIYERPSWKLVGIDVKIK